MAKILGLFPGQGSQKVGMGNSYLSNPLAQSIFHAADEVLGFSLSKICAEGPESELTKTAVAQPAILTVSIIAYKIWCETTGKSLSCAAGHSLGEYSALVAAGSLSFEDAVLLVHKRGKYMQEAVPLGAGRMVAVLGKELTEIEDALANVKNGVAEVANINAPGQIVVAGDKEGVGEFVPLLGKAKVIDLAVSAPFHCSLMTPAAVRLMENLSSININPASFPIYANISGSPLTDPEAIRKALGAQVCGRVRWVECMENAIRDTKPEEAVEFGEGAVLAGLLKKIDNSVLRTNV